MIRFRASFSDIAKIKNAAKNVLREAEKQSVVIPKLASREFASFMITAIFKQNYRSSKPYNKKYEEWKLKHVKHLEQWRVEDFLVKSIASSKISNTKYFAGIRAGIMAVHTIGRTNPQSKEIAFYGKINEQIRPLFKPGFKDFSKNQFPKLVERSGYTIQSGWKK